MSRCASETCYRQRPIIITTNKPLTEWNLVFPSAGCIVTLIDRLAHKAEIVQIDAESYRLKEAKERAAARKKRRRAGRRQPTPAGDGSRDRLFVVPVTTRKPAIRGVS